MANAAGLEPVRYAGSSPARGIKIYSPRDGIGIHGTFKMSCSKEHAGSNPAEGINDGPVGKLAKPASSKLVI